MMTADVIRDMMKLMPDHTVIQIDDGAHGREVSALYNRPMSRPALMLDGPGVIDYSPSVLVVEDDVKDLTEAGWVDVKGIRYEIESLQPDGGGALLIILREA